MVTCTKHLVVPTTSSYVTPMSKTTPTLQARREGLLMLLLLSTVMMNGCDITGIRVCNAAMVQLPT